jgi:SPP1 gp7 family putative phage head morphogenesis protein
VTLHFTIDRDPISAKSIWIRARKVEIQYASRLRQIAKHIGELVNGMWDGDFEKAIFIESALQRYSNILDPWAVAVAERMIAEVDARDKVAWRRISAQMGRAVEREIQSAPVGAVTQRLMANQVALIKSLPLDAAQRVHKLAMESLSTGARASELSDMIMRSGEVSKSRANSIARTETGRSHTTFTQARAEHIGSETYTWLTSGDGDVREDHKILNGKVFRWDAPPIADRRTGARAHPGCIYECRCIALPNIPDI